MRTKPVLLFGVILFVAASAAHALSVDELIAKNAAARGGLDKVQAIKSLKLEGKLLGPWVDELRRVCEELHTPPSGLRLNLAGVTFIDPAGIKLLGDLIRLGAVISECTGFVDELLRRNPSGR